MTTNSNSTNRLPDLDLSKNYILAERWLAWFMILALFVGAWIGLWAVDAPKNAVESAISADFQYPMALKHLQTICQKPHSMGTAEHTRVREYMVGYLRLLGVEVEVQALPFVEEYERAGTSVLHIFKPHNVLVRLRGTDKNAQTVLVAGHYDSVEQGPGASDDGVAVACMLELIRLLKVNKIPLKNDVVFLFSDGEEINLLGAKTFMQHEWAKNIGFILNFEARGSEGAPLLFQTNANNLAAINAFAEVVPFRQGNSAAVEVYKMMPNGTDFMVFESLKKQGLNFAFIGNHPAYHTVQDNVQNLDKNTFATMGLNMTALVKHFANTDLTKIESEQDAVFFHDGLENFWYWPASQSHWAFSILAVGLAALILIGRLLGKFYLTSVFLWAFLTLFYAGLAALLGWGFWEFVLKSTHPHLGEAVHGAVYASEYFLMAFVLLIEGILLIIMQIFHKKERSADAQAGGLIVWLLLSAICNFKFVGVSYIVLLPTGLGLVGLFLAVWFEDMTKTKWLSGLLLILPALGVVFLASPFLVSVLQALTFKLVAALMLLYALFAGALNGIRTWILQRLGWGAIWLVLLSGSMALLWASLNSFYSQDQKRPNSLYFMADLDKKEYAWFSGDSRLDEFTTQFLGSTPEIGNLSSIFSDINKPQFRQKADTVIMDTLISQLFAPEIRVREVKKMPNGSLEVDFDFVSARAAEHTHLYIAGETLPESIQVADTVIWRAINKPSRHIALINFEGSERFVWTLPKGQNIRFKVVEGKLGLNEVASGNYKARRKSMMPSPNVRTTDHVYVIKSYDIDPSQIKMPDKEKLGFQTKNSKNK